ncbi:hypothetical protein Vadar_003233 [Vaccinium darrowii]|uniref:Uncharacterized protein n=1 Tax=Vaccinium darrowii TaxID=229202 RepID=A0ACB7Y651_9ERIC|nr:hypothetical protein Vadar_003233 [Vaccinium darrowii]
MDYYQQPQMSDVQIQLQIQRQLLLKLQQQQQAILEQQRPFLDPSQSFSRSVAPSQTLDMPQAISTSLPQAHLNLIPRQISGTNSQQNLISFSHPFQQSDFPGHVSHTPTSNQLATAGTGTWAPPPSQFQRMRTYTKVYKTGSVGRSIDVTRYSGYEELRQDLARIFGIEGQLENRCRVGWKLVWVDHENDVLVVGDYPWEEFVHCVRCIKILSPQEVQAMISAGISLLTGAAGGS